MERPDHDSAPRSALFVTEGDFLDDSVESAGHGSLFRALVDLGVTCHVACRFLGRSDQEPEPGPWLAARGWQAEDGPGEGVLRVTADGLPVTLSHGSSTKPHAPDDAERAGFLRLVTDALGRGRPEVVLARSGPSLGAVLDAARSRGVAAVAQPDGTPRDPAPFR